VRKVAFPIHILPAVPLCAAVLVHGVLFALLLIILAWYGLYPRPGFLMVLYYLAAALLFTLGLGWLLAAAHVFSRDVGQALNTALNILFWMTPILWPAANIGGWTKFVLQLNPAYFIVEGYRSALLPGGHAFALWPLDLYFWGLTLVLLAAGATVFRRFESDFADVLR
jgi:ABC-type polysaccharide/polyol phosphate export permease